MVWNEIEDVWYLIYTGFVNELPEGKRDAVYDQLSSGNSHRKLTQALGELTFAELPEYVKELRSLVSQTNELARLRNEMTHAGYGYSIENGMLGLYIHGTGTGSKKRSMSGANESLIDELSGLNAKLDALLERVDDFRIIISQEFFQSPIPSPEIVAKMQLQRQDVMPKHASIRVAPPRLQIGDGPYTHLKKNIDREKL